MTVQLCCIVYIWSISFDSGASPRVRLWSWTLDNGRWTLDGNKERRLEGWTLGCWMLDEWIFDIEYCILDIGYLHVSCLRSISYAECEIERRIGDGEFNLQYILYTIHGMVCCCLDAGFPFSTVHSTVLCTVQFLFLRQIWQISHDQD